jgi:imidazole glycerol-phosphate synthase subunit HisH
MADAILVDAGTGNLHSVYNALTQLGYSIQVTSSPADLRVGARVILPGVGAFGKFMEGLRQRGLEGPIQAQVARGDLLLGICVGMQALFELSEEMGTFPGLRLLPGKVVCFTAAPGLKVPHTGWNQIWPARPTSLLKNIRPGSYAYFNHSYFCAPTNPANTAATTDYGALFTSVLQHGSLYAVQFHPEKSQAVGLQILKNFMEL